MNLKIKVRYALYVLLLLGAFLFVFYRDRERKISGARMKDVTVLTHLCLTSTNIHSTEELYAAAADQGIRLVSPLPKDSSKPCYRLVNPYDPTRPQQLLIQETNIRDQRRVYSSTMDGGISMRWN